MSTSVKSPLYTRSEANGKRHAGQFDRGPAKPTVWHLHGCIGNAARLILTPGGYDRLYPSDGEARYQAALVTLRTLLVSRSLLFVGFSFADERFGIELEGVRDLFEGHAGTHYALVHQGDAVRLRQIGIPVELVTFESHGPPLVELVEELASYAPAPEEGEADENRDADTDEPAERLVEQDVQVAGLPRYEQPAQEPERLEPFDTRVTDTSRYSGRYRNQRETK